MFLCKAKDIYLEPTRDGNYTFNKTIQALNESDSGVYACEATNRGNVHVKFCTSVIYYLCIYFYILKEICICILKNCRNC